MGAKAETNYRDIEKIKRELWLVTKDQRESRLQKPKEIMLKKMSEETEDKNKTECKNVEI
jgi:hypothetical protein